MAIAVRVIGFFAAALVVSLMLARGADRFLFLPPSFANDDIGILIGLA